MKKFDIALDVDEVLTPCLEQGCQVLGIDPRRITDWNLRKTELSDEEVKALMLIICSPEFVRNQVPYPGAVEMVQELVNDGHRVMIATAVDVDCMANRTEMLLHWFPMLSRSNIMLGARKELLNVDFLLDDSPYNFGQAKFFVLMERWYNRNIKGFLSVSNYEEFLSMVRQAAAAPEDGLVHVGKVGYPGFICLVGPSASGKSVICDVLERHPLFRKVRAVTDRQPRSDEQEGREYNFVSRERFQDMVHNGEMLEYTKYAGFDYGICKDEVESIWAEGHIAIKPVDISGAKAIKAIYPDRTLTLFVRRDKEALLTALLSRDVPLEDKVSRVMTLDAEYANEPLCDWTISNNGSISHAVEQVLRLL